MILFFDTETTGVPRNHKAPASDLENWPRLVQLAWILTDEDGLPIEAVETIVRPDGFTIPSDATAVHGITTKTAREKGLDLIDVLKHFQGSLLKAEKVIAHNLQFDEKIVGAEFLRCQLPNPIASMPRASTMLASTQLCQMPGRYGHKWPSLEELYRHLFGKVMEEAHNALVDANSCARCYFELRQRGLMH
jgi:DNA polymerase-3 subunit epsilon